MIYSIYTAAGVKRTDFDGNSNSTHDHKVQTNNELSLSFTLHDYVALEVNDYIDIGNMRFVLMKPYKPVMKSTKEYAYDVKFYGPENIAGAAIFLDSDYNPISSYYDTPSAQLAFIVNCINRASGDTHYHVGEVVSSEPINVEYTRGCTCLEALSTLSKACNTEWWLDGTNFNLSKCEHGEPVTLAYGRGLLNLTKEIADTDEFFTRLLPTGSTKNIVASKYGHTTLQLPDGKKWIDRNVDLYGIKEKWEEDAFADIFPRFTGTVGTVRTEMQTIDGSEVTVYYFKAPDIPFNPNSYSIANTNKHVVFKSGDLLGQDFEANWHEDTAEWELITQYPTENTQLPGDNVIPRTGDKYTVYNLDMPTEYYPLAEQEFEDAVNALLDNAAIDFATYKSPTDHTYLEDNEIALTLGRRVRLENDIYFPEGYRDSRITRIVRKLSDLNDMDIEISNTIIQGQYATLKSDVADLKNTFAQTLANEILNVLRTNSSADLTDENVLSSLRTLKEIKNRAVSRLNDDKVEGLIKFLKGLKSLDNIDIGTFVSGLLGSGIRLSESGYAEMSGLTLREFLEVPELRFNRVDVVSGELWNAIAFGTIESVDIENQIATLHLVDGELRGIHLQDFCRGIFHNLEGNSTSPGKDENGFDIMPGFSTTYFTPTELLEDGASFKYSLKPGTTIHPCASMKFAVYGNPIDKSRQSSAYDTRTYKRYLKSVDTWEITADNIAMQFGDCSGLVIDGVDLSGYSAYLNNIYITGVIKWLEDNIDKLKGKDAYIVELSSYYAIVNVNSQGQIDDSVYDLVNIVSGENYTYTGDYQIVQVKYKIQTKVQVSTQSAVLEYVESDPGDGQYSLSVVATGCTWEKYGDYLTLKSISEDFATLEITVNCEGTVSILKTFQVKRVYDGQDAALPDWVQNWNNNKTLLGDTYVVSPTMFSGTKDSDGKLTGIAMGRDCLTINGVKRTGIFALVADKIVFQLDPITRFYSYQGSIATPPTVINSSNLSNYGEISIINHILTWNIDLKKTGFNVQMDSLNGGDINLSGTINLPRESQYEGVEFNLINTFPGNVVVVNGYGYFDDAHTGKVNRDTKLITFLTQYKFKCIVFTPPTGYQYSLVDGKAIEWVLINN